MVQLCEHVLAYEQLRSRRAFCFMRHATFLSDAVNNIITTFSAAACALNHAPCTQYCTYTFIRSSWQSALAWWNRYRQVVMNVMRSNRQCQLTVKLNWFSNLDSIWVFWKLVSKVLIYNVWLTTQKIWVCKLIGHL